MAKCQDAITIGISNEEAGTLCSQIGSVETSARDTFKNPPVGHPNAIGEMR